MYHFQCFYTTPRRRARTAARRRVDGGRRFADDPAATHVHEIVRSHGRKLLVLGNAVDGLIEVGHGKLLVFEPRHLGWWIAMVNALGCLWFMQSALAALPNDLPKLSVLNAGMAIRTTLLGSLCFAIVGILSLAECSEDEISSI